ncbi:MAG: NAD(P)-dependent oxidoreductase [Bacteroidales bacterium]|nr:NAD(P)-dependent oxidoreductase [Bacteroidales bacterium]
MKHVIVFGATGTVGAYTCLQLKEDGFAVTAAGGRKSDNGFFARHGIPYVSVDICSALSFDVLPQKDVYGIVQLAGMLPARMEGYTPQRYIDINVTGMLNFLEYAVRCGARRVVYSQSISDVDYLMGTTVPVPEDAPSRFPGNNDHSVYSICKNAAADLLRHYSYKFGIKPFILRFPNIYLYHPNPYYYVNGELRMQGYRKMIYMAMAGRDIEVWGNPSRVRDIVYVKDCTQLISRCFLTENATGGNYNVGTGVGVTLEDQVKGIIEVFSPRDNPSRLLYSPEKPDAAQYIFDISNARKDLGYQPKYLYMDYLKDFKREMEQQRFRLLWGPEITVTL